MCPGVVNPSSNVKKYTFSYIDKLIDKQKSILKKKIIFYFITCIKPNTTYPNKLIVQGFVSFFTKKTLNI